MGQHRINDDGHMRWFSTDEEYYTYLKVREYYTSAEGYDRARANFNSDEELLYACQILQKRDKTKKGINTFFWIGSVTLLIIWISVHWNITTFIILWLILLIIKVVYTREKIKNIR